MKPIGIILSAGESRRMGSPKALLEIEGRTFLDHLVDLLQPLCESVVVVLGHEPDRIPIAGARTVVNPDYRLGMLTSLQCSLRSVPAECGPYLFTPVDLPAIDISTVRRVAEAPGEIVIPRYMGRAGHPVRFGADTRRKLLDLAATASPRDVLRQDERLITYVDVHDPEIVNDIDTPDDYRRLLERKGAVRS